MKMSWHPKGENARTGFQARAEFCTGRQPKRLCIASKKPKGTPNKLISESVCLGCFYELALKSRSPRTRAVQRKGLNNECLTWFFDACVVDDAKGSRARGDGSRAAQPGRSRGLCDGENAVAPKKPTTKTADFQLLVLPLLESGVNEMQSGTWRRIIEFEPASGLP